MVHQIKQSKSFRLTLLILGLFLLQSSLAQAQLSPSTNLLSEPLNRNSSQIDQAYLLGVGDQIDISVFDYSEFSGSKIILPDGSITLPLLGSIVAAGQTTEQFSQNLTIRLQSLLVNPVVTVSLTSLRPVLVNVAGEVRRPGPLQLASLENGIPTLSAAIVAAGGITQDANIRQITIQRQGGSGSSSTITIDLWSAITSDNEPADTVLQGGDSIHIPKLSADDMIDRRLAARSSFAPTVVRVRVIGEVNNPGEIEISPDSSISSAVAIAGGPTEDARMSNVALVRLNDDGAIERQLIDLRNLTDEHQVQEGDVLIVPKTDAASILDVAERLLSPLNFLLNLF